MIGAASGEGQADVYNGPTGHVPGRAPAVDGLSLCRARVRMRVCTSHSKVVLCFLVFEIPPVLRRTNGARPLSAAASAGWPYHVKPAVEREASPELAA